MSRGEVGRGGSCVRCAGLVGSEKTILISVAIVVASVELIRVR